MIPLASRRLAVVCAAVVTVALPAAGSAQSLADVARAEQARRKQQTTPSKVYTNDSVKTDITPSMPSTPPVEGSAPAPDAKADAAPSTADAPATPVASAAGAERRDQAYWKGRITGAREQLERSKTFAEALQTRINALTADFVNRDDPAQQTVIGQNRTKAVAELDRVQREIASQTKAIAAIEDEARKAGVPSGWLR
jgi:hypothetical protein